MKHIEMEIPRLKANMSYYQQRMQNWQQGNLHLMHVWIDCEFFITVILAKTSFWSFNQTTALLWFR